MLWCLHNDKHGELYSLDEKVYIVDTDDLKVDKSTFGELLPYLKNGLVIENVSTDITDNLADFVEVKNALSMSNRLLAGDLSMLSGSLIFKHCVNRVRFNYCNTAYDIQLEARDNYLAFWINKDVYYYIGLVSQGLNSNTWSAHLEYAYMWNGYIVVTISVRNNLGNASCLVRLFLKDGRFIGTCITNQIKLLNVSCLREETDECKVITTKYKIKNLPY